MQAMDYMQTRRKFLLKACYQRENLPPEKQLSDLPKEDEQGVVWYDDLEFEPRKMEGKPPQFFTRDDPSKKIVPFNECPKRCFSTPCIPCGLTSYLPCLCHVTYGETKGWTTACLPCMSKRSLHDSAWPAWVLSSCNTHRALQLWCRIYTCRHHASCMYAHAARCCRYSSCNQSHAPMMQPHHQHLPTSPPHTHSSSTMHACMQVL